LGGGPVSERITRISSCPRIKQQNNNDQEKNNVRTGSGAFCKVASAAGENSRGAGILFGGFSAVVLLKSRREESQQAKSDEEQKGQGRAQLL
jgi:hypothetical protein